MKSLVRTEFLPATGHPPADRGELGRRFGARESRRVGAFVLALVASLSSLAIGACRPSSDALDPQSLPENVRADYQIFARRCSKCHSLARPLTAGITDQGQWESYVARMRMQPASGITADDQVVILRFLKFYSDEERRKKSEKNGAAQAASASTPAPTSPAPTSPAPTSPAPTSPAPPSAPANPPAVAPVGAPGGAR